jgi:hypothetical protein
MELYRAIAAKIIILKQTDCFWGGSLSFVSDNGHGTNREFVPKETMQADQVVSQAINQYTTLRLSFSENIVACISDYRWGLDWMIGFINTSYNQLNSYLQAIWRSRLFTQFTVHRYTRTRIPSLH